MLFNKMAALLAAVLLCLSLPLTSCNSNGAGKDETLVNGVRIPNLLPRKNAADTAGEYMTIHETYDKAVLKIKEDTSDVQAYLNLATAYIIEGRITGNSSYYSNAAIKVLNKALNGEVTTPDQRFEALSLKSTVLLNMHQFKQALDAANEGLALNGYNASIYGALVDANLELGNYDAAVKACDQMLSIRPDLRSYSRASYLRQIYGDNRGAIDAMKMAVDAGVPGVEQTEWARVTLGDLYLNIGNADSASLTYRTALVYRPNYPFALMGMAKVARARKNYDEAITHTKEAIRTLGESSFVAYLADLYELKGDAAQAEKVRKDVVDLLEKGEKEQSENAAVPHNGNRELAMAYLNIRDYDKAQSFAKKDYDMRPNNIDANELMSWIAYLKGDLANAKAYAAKTDITHTRNANLLYKNAMIYAKAGESVRADTTRKLALSISPLIDQRVLNAERK